MKKIDKLVLSSFLGLFVLTVCAAFFVLLMQFFLVNFDELLGKGLGLGIYAKLASYVGIMATKQAFPLAILLASIMALGNLGEHSELTALKSAGIPLPRILLPLFFLVLLLSSLVFFSNSYVVPRAYLDVYSLLYDLGRKKPSVAIKEGVFYDGIPGYSIKVRKKLDDQKTLQGIMLYDHTQGRGNVSLTMAESGKIYTTHDEAYLMIELFNGHNYVENPRHSDTPTSRNEPMFQFYRSSFKVQKLRISLASLQLSRTDKELFAGSYRTKNSRRLAADVVAMQRAMQEAKQSLNVEALRFLAESGSAEVATEVLGQDNLTEIANILNIKAAAEQYGRAKTQFDILHSDGDPLISPSTLYKVTDLTHIYGSALDRANIFKKKLVAQDTEIKRLRKEIQKHELTRNKMLAWAVSCIIVFLVGAPLGVIIKRGGLGISLFVATGLIIWHYFFEMLGEKWAQEGVIGAFSGAWLANSLLLPFGILFLQQAYRDAYFLGGDFYMAWFKRLRRHLDKVTYRKRSVRG